MLTGTLARRTRPTAACGARHHAFAVKSIVRLRRRQRLHTFASAPRSAPLGVTILGIAILLSASAAPWRSPALAAEGGATGVPSGLPVTVAEVRQKCFTDTLETAGRLVPRQEILVRPEIEGLRISQVLVDDGDRVTEGQVLARLGRAEGPQGPSLPASATIKSPVAGVVSYRAAQARATATVRGEPLFRLIADGEMELQAEVPATRISKLAAGQSATVELPGVSEPIPGHVRSVSSSIDPKTQMAGARIFIGDRRLPVGAFAKSIVVIGQRCGFEYSVVVGHSPPRGRDRDRKSVV